MEQYGGNKPALFQVSQHNDFCKRKHVRHSVSSELGEAYELPPAFFNATCRSHLWNIRSHDVPRLASSVSDTPFSFFVYICTDANAPVVRN